MINRMRLKSLLHEMVNIYSPSGKETDLLDYLRSYLKGRGARPLMQPVDEHRCNLLVLPERGPDIELALIGHLDTVSAYDIEDYGFAADGDRVRGLGTADMKSGCAAMIEAYTTFQYGRQFRAPAALCLVVGEEENGDGAARLIADYHFPWAIVGEPTNLFPCLSCYGYAEIRISSTAKRRHASVAAGHENAIESLLGAMGRVSHFLRENHPEVVYNFRDLYSAPSGFTAPDYCEAWMDIHMPPDAPMEDRVRSLEALGRKPAGGEADLNECALHFEVETLVPGYALAQQGRLFRALQSVYARNALPWRTKPFRSHCDAHQLRAAGIQPIVLGPGRLEHAHASDEWVSFNQVCQAAEVYVGLMQALF